jgi:hypothetical protein
MLLPQLRIQPPVQRDEGNGQTDDDPKDADGRGDGVHRGALLAPLVAQRASLVLAGSIVALPPGAVKRSVGACGTPGW